MQAHRIYFILRCNRHALYVNFRKYLDRVDTDYCFYHRRVFSILLQIKQNGLYLVKTADDYDFKFKRE